MKPRRILHITREHDGGLAVVIDRLVRNFDRNNYELFVAFDTPWQSNIRRKLCESDFKIINLMKIHEQQVPHNINKKKKNIGKFIETKFGKTACIIYLFIKSAFEFLIKEVPKIKIYICIIKKYEIDIVHTHSNLHYGKAEIIASNLCGIPCVTHNHAYPNYTMFDRLFTKLVTKYIYISKDVAKKNISLGEPREKGIIINNGLDVKKFLKNNDKFNIKEKYNIGSDDILIGMIGRIDWWKGQNYFIEAIGHVAKIIPNLKGFIIGNIYNDPYGKNQDYMDSLLSLIRFLKIDDKIIFTGYRDDIPQFINCLDIIIHASSEPEPFGLVIIEAMAAGKPVIATAEGGVLDIIEDKVNGLLVPCKDAESIAQAILKIISNKKYAKKMGYLARQHVINKFTIQQQVMKVQNLYNSILNLNYPVACKQDESKLDNMQPSARRRLKVKAKTP